MSALGHKRTFCDAEVMSALPPIADMCGATRDVRLSANSGHRRLFDHLICTSRHGRRDFKAESLCSFRIDYKLEFNRLLNWQLCWLGAFKNFPHVDTHLSVSLREANPVTHQPACHGIFTKLVNRGYSRLSREGYDPVTSGIEEWIGANKKRFNSLFDKRSKSGLQFPVGACFRNSNSLTDALCGILHFTSLVLRFGIVWINEHTYQGRFRYDLMQQSKTFRFQAQWSTD